MKTTQSKRAASFFEHKIHSRQSLVAAVHRWKREGKRVVFTNGCFDLLHRGHVTLLAQAKRLGGVLIVAVNSDRSVRALKGPNRPIVPQRDRAVILAALSSVDAVTIFDRPTPHHLITLLKPDVLVKGADWRVGGIVGEEVVKRHGGRVVRVPLVSGRSTTDMVTRIARKTAKAT
ncbi:MAG: D-glycero-beta-D-manno-heptose 1-phosphate adenylyltransferase [Candidatus Omnitrophica bacterium]|nr:D-glycero-beta-D-manno-heptose 1-phosphate adenylyltransferase [Candidatus Omnitrophota bacterium]